MYSRLNPDGLGRNMSLFMVMKRYDCSLKEYLSAQERPLNWKTSLMLLTQLLEGRWPALSKSLIRKSMPD
jgi:PTEN induced putative kinase 1